MARPSEAWAPGVVIPGTDYRIVGLIGRGGFGDVFEVEHVHLTRRFAVKVLSHAHAGRGDLVERLKREARALAQLHPHPNLVEVTDLRESSDGRAFLVMERLRGRTLGESMRAGRPAPIAQAADVMRQLLRALGAAHRVGLVHRDVKPSNVFLCDGGVVKLLDFGIVKVLHEKGGGQTMPGAAVGTPGYMAPEHVEGVTPDARSDVYSAGVVFWEMLAGGSPFPSDLCGHELLARVVTQGVPALEDEGHGALPAGLRAVVRRATERRPEARYASADEFALGLEEALRGDDVPRPGRVLKAGPPRPRAEGTAPEGAAPPVSPAGRASHPALPAGRASHPALPAGRASPPALPVGRASLPVLPAGRASHPVLPAGRALLSPPPAHRASPLAPNTPRVRYDAVTVTPPASPAAPAASDDEAADTLRAPYEDAAASLCALFEDADAGEGSVVSTPEVDSVPNPDRVEYAVAYPPAPHAGARGASRRVVLGPPPVRPAASGARERALAFAPTLPSAAALADRAPPDAGPASEAPAALARAPYLSTVETKVRNMPTPTAVPALAQPVEPAGPPPARGAAAPGALAARARRASRSGLAAIGLIAALGLAWVYGRGGTRRPDGTDSNLYVYVAPAAAASLPTGHPARPPSAGAAPPVAADAAPSGPAADAAPSGPAADAAPSPPNLAAGAALSNSVAVAAPSASNAPAIEGPGAGLAPRASLASAAPVADEAGRDVAGAAPSAQATAAKAGLASRPSNEATEGLAGVASAVAIAVADAAPASGPTGPMGSGAVAATASPGPSEPAPSPKPEAPPAGSPRVAPPPNPSDARPGPKARAEAPAPITASAGAPRRDGKPPPRARKALGPSHDF